MAGLTRWRPGATRTGGVMGLTTEHDGPGRPAGPDRRVEGYETVPLLIAGTAGNANGNGMIPGTYTGTIMVISTSIHLTMSQPISVTFTR